MIAPHRSLAWRATVAYTVCVIVEVSQLIHFPALDSLRGTRVGHLVLGSDFDVRDLLAYALGVLLAAFVARALTKLLSRNGKSSRADTKLTR